MPGLIFSKFSLPLLLLFAAFASMARPVPSSSAESSIRAKVQPEVRAALAGGPATARVLVELRKPPSLAAGRPDIARARVQVAAEQTLVLAAVAPSDVQVIYRYQALPALAGQVNERGLAALAAQPEVTQITLDGVGTAADAQSLPLIHADEVQAAGITGAGITVAVLDTGIDTNNIDLEDDITYERCFLSNGGCPSGAHPAEDDNGHGTNVAGIITSNGTVAPVGVAPGAKIAAYKILNASGAGTLSDQVAALDDIIANHPEVNIVNMSLESNGPCPAGALGAAVTTLRTMGVATFIAAGNFGMKDSLFIPACIPDGISVGATYDANIGSSSGWETNCTDQTTRADQVACWSNSDDTLDLLAPGDAITSTGMGGGLSSYRGTSQASPHAAGVAALLMQSVPGLSVDEIENRMKQTGTMITDDLHDNNPNTNRQTPRIDARVALLTDPNQDYDGDGCPNGKEFGQDERLGGRRNPLNQWDYFNPTHDGKNRVDDILAVVHQYNKNRYLPSPPNPPNTPNPDYTTATDRSFVGPNLWNLGPPDGMQGVDDILYAVAQYRHDCS
jgi:subtilisin family serine protease